MLKGIAASSAHNFMETLARVLNVTVSALAADGSVRKIYNPLPPYTELSSSPALAAAYRDFFQAAGRGGPGRSGILEDPLGLSAAVITLEQGEKIVLGGRLHGRFFDLADFQNRLLGYGVDADLKKWVGVPPLTRVELCQVAEIVYDLCRLPGSLLQAPEEERYKLYFGAVEQYKKLVCGFFGTCFHWDLFLNFTAAFLRYLSGGQSGWITARRPTGGLDAALCGNGKALRERVELERDRLARGSAVTERWYGISCREEKEAYGTFVQAEVHTRCGCSAALGVAAPSSTFLKTVLETFAHRVGLALEGACLFQGLQQNIGLLCNSLRHGLVTISGEGVALSINRAARDMLSAQGVALEPGDMLAGSGLCSDMETAVEEAVQKGLPSYQRRSTIGAGDSILHLRWDAMPVYGIGGDVTGAILVLEDITEPVNFFREMRNWERLAVAGEIAAGLAHEVRNPLATAKASLQLFQIIDDEEKRMELLNKLSAELDRMNEILTDFLTISKPQQNESFQPVYPDRILQELEFLLRSEALLREIDLEIKGVDGKTPPVMGNPGSLKQVFINIAKNAFDAVDEGGRVEIALTCLQSRVYITFRDNGSGISEENRRKIMRPFFTTKPGGTGLGLPISSSLIKMMGGEIKIQSRPGHGTVVEVILPLCQGKSGVRPSQLTKEG